MAKRKGSQGSSRKRSMRSSLRSLRQAVSGVVAITRPPNDPPPLNFTTQHTVRYGFKILSSNTQYNVAVNKAGSVGLIHLQYVKNNSAYNIFKLDVSHLRDAYAFAHGFSAGSEDIEVAVNKICMWGMLPQLGGSSVTLCYSDRRSTRVVSDTGTANSRPRVGLTIPYLNWLDKPAGKDDGYIEGTLDVGGMFVADKAELGYLLVTLTGRRKHSL